MSEDVRFVLVGNGGYSNRGCEAIVRGTTRILRRRFPDPTFFLCGGTPRCGYDVGREVDPRIVHRPLAGVPWSPRWFVQRTLGSVGWGELSVRLGYSRRRLLRSLTGAACALGLGGDNYSIYSSRALPPRRLTFDRLVKDAMRRLQATGVLRCLMFDRVIQGTGTPLVLFGCSVGPFSADPALEKVMAKHLRTLSLICARETETIRYLASIGVEENVRLVADPAFALEPVEPELPDHVRQFVERGPVGVNLSGLAGWFAGGGKGSWRELAVGCIDELLKSGADEVLLVPHVIEPLNDDHQFLTDIACALPQHKDRICVAPRNLNAAGYKWVIGRSRVFAGARMHSTIASLSSGVPTLMIGYSMKAKGLAKDIYGSEEWLVPVQDLEPRQFAARVAQLLAREDELRSHLRSVIPAQVGRAFGAADYVAEILRA